MIDLITGLLMRGDRNPNPNPPRAQTRMHLIGVVAVRVALWIILSILLAFALAASIVLLVNPLA